MADEQPTSEETVRFTPREPPGPPPPTATQPMFMPPPPGAPRRQLALLTLIALILGLAAGFGLAQLFGKQDPRVPDPNLVMFEHASSTFPVPEAAFTRTTFDPSRRQCDKELLKQYLRADPQRFKAWLGVQDISEDDFDAFVDRLETRILDAYTPVTNFGCFADGDGPCPFSIQSVLAPGTPVWFDPDQRRIVAKCACSNPLKAPRCPPNCNQQVAPPATTAPPRTQAPRTPPPATPPPTEEPTEQPPPTEEPTPFPTFGDEETPFP